MKSRLTILLLFISMVCFGQSVPNTNTFRFVDVKSVVGGTSLSALFANSVDSYFDANYKGNKDRLSNFRNYTSVVSTPPTVSTYTLSNIQDVTATGGGDVTQDGGETVTARGVCWDTINDPTTADSHTTDGTGLGAFSSSLTGLLENKTYYVKAYATNSVGTSYGSQINIHTLYSNSIFAQAKKSETPNATPYDYVQSDNQYYVSLGISYDVNENFEKDFSTTPSIKPIYYRLMANNPYRSLWLGGVNVPESKDTVTISKDLIFSKVKTIHVLIIGDNTFTVKVNGQIIHAETDPNYVYNFEYLHIIPVTTGVGNNHFEFSGRGDGDVNQALGILILDNTKDELFDNPVTKDKWNVLFSSNSLIGSGTTYTCSANYSYDADEGKCVSITDLSNWVVGDKVLISLVIPDALKSQITSWTIDFGDSSSQNGSSFQNLISHSYSSSGTKTITYTATLQDGNSIYETQHINLP